MLIKVKKRAGIAQLVEQWTENPRVTSSSLVPGIFVTNLHNLKGLYCQFFGIVTNCGSLAIKLTECIWALI